MTEQSKLVAAIVAATVVIFGGLVFALLRTPSDQLVNPAGTVVFNDATSVATGKLDSPVVVRMYSDFQCPACKAAEPALAKVMAEFGDRVKFIWKDFPLMTIHFNARAAANAARCAADQGKFWDMRDRLFASQDAWSGLSNPKGRFAQLARDAGTNADQFTSCYDDRSHDDAVMADVKEGEKNGVNATPTFYINNQQAQVRTEAQWRAALNAALAASVTTTPAPAATSTNMAPTASTTTP